MDVVYRFSSRAGRGEDDTRGDFPYRAQVEVRRDELGWGSGASFPHGVLCMVGVLDDEENPHVSVPGQPDRSRKRAPFHVKRGQSVPV